MEGIVEMENGNHSQLGTSALIPIDAAKGTFPNQQEITMPQQGGITDCLLLIANPLNKVSNPWETLSTNREER